MWGVASAVSPAEGPEEGRERRCPGLPTASHTRSNGLMPAFQQQRVLPKGDAAEGQSGEVGKASSSLARALPSSGGP